MLKDLHILVNILSHIIFVLTLYLYYDLVKIITTGGQKLNQKLLASLKRGGGYFLL